MAEKKTVSVKPAAKAVAEKAVEVKKEVVAEVKEAAKEVKAPVKKEAAAKKETVKKAPAAKKAPAKKEAAAKKETVKKAPAAKKETAKKAAVVTLEYKGNAYTEASLVQSAKDVWVYDLGKDLKDFKSVELYVKPEENTVYYVINKEVTGGFAL